MYSVYSERQTDCVKARLQELHMAICSEQMTFTIANGSSSGSMTLSMGRGNVAESNPNGLAFNCRKSTHILHSSIFLRTRTKGALYGLLDSTCCCPHVDYLVD